MVAVNSSSPTPASAGMWEAQAMGDGGAIGDSSAESLYVQGKQTQELTSPSGVVYHGKSKNRVSSGIDHQQLYVCAVEVHLCVLIASFLPSSA